jgi:hypothetical protein
VLFARKGEGTIESLERKRQEYLALAPEVARFRRVDATQPVDAVVAEVIAAIEALLAEQAGTSPVGAPAADVAVTPAEAGNPAEAATPTEAANAATRSDAA